MSVLRSCICNFFSFFNFHGALEGDTRHFLTEREKAEKRIFIIKLGSDMVVDDEGLRTDHIQSCAYQVAELMRQRYAPMIITSGAVKLGRIAAGNMSLEKAVAASIGSPILMNAWREALRNAGATMAEFLIHDDTFDTARTTMQKATQIGCVPVINRQDAVNVEGDTFTRDNDMVATALTLACEADHCVYFTGGGGVRNDADNIVSEITNHTAWQGWIRAGTSAGTGDMESKVNMALTAAKNGTYTVIAGFHETALTDIASGEHPYTNVRYNAN